MFNRTSLMLSKEFTNFLTSYKYNLWYEATVNKTLLKEHYINYTKID